MDDTAAGDDRHDLDGDFVAVVRRGYGERKIRLKRPTEVAEDEVVVSYGSWKQVKIFALRHSWKIHTRRRLG